jgi:hypothetical protein
MNQAGEGQAQAGQVGPRRKKMSREQGMEFTGDIKTVQGQTLGKHRNQGQGTEHTEVHSGAQAVTQVK